MALSTTPPSANFSAYGTIREAYIDISTELLKEESPTLYVEDFLYYYNKAVSEYMKARYELFEITQQLTDDLRFWKTSHIETSEGTNLISPFVNTDDIQPRYRHVLSCVIGIEITKPIASCSQLPRTTSNYRCKRLSSDIKAAIIDNVYLEPKFFRPYYDILDKTIFISAGDLSDNSIILRNITIEYLRQPGRYTMSASQVAAKDDQTQGLEFTRDVGEEITKVAVKLILERGSDPRLQSNVAVNQSINDISIQK